MKQKEEAFARGICFKKIFWLFMIGCVFGCVFEMVNHFIHYGDWVSRRGLIYGPLNPVYGLGLVFFVIFLSKIKNPALIFLGGMLLGGGCEYLCSLVQEKVFGTLSWDYSHQLFNIGGRTSLKYMIVWGVLALLVMRIVYPFLSNLIEKMPVKTGNILTAILIVFMVANIIISVTACLRQSERAKGMEPSNKVEVFLDKHYPDKRLNTIFQNAKRQK
ncbi:uncharacterized protein BN793_00864 [Firmicutes bacterium CAG:822]|nr:uncharacterized protein BN793_00864 [Firmicutes bacterium CAG:822]